MHLDIKPANIMLRESDDTPILIDFGLAKQYDSSGDQTSTTPIGISHGYAPVEQYRPGGVSTFTPQTDVYSLAATLYALLSGSTPPHYSDILEDGLPELPSSVNRITVKAIEKAMETKKTKRPASIDEFLAMLPSNVVEIDKKDEVTNPDPHAATEEYQTIDTKDSMTEVDEVVNDKVKSSSTCDNTSHDEKPKEDVPEQKFVEETVILNVPLSNYTTKLHATKNDSAEPQKSQPEEPSEMSYLDLGLSVKWATKLSGVAKPVMNEDVYRFELDNRSVVKPCDFVSRHQLPTIKQFEELIERCSWTTFSENGLHGYKIIGPNGNILMMPLGTLNRYLSTECLKPDCLYYYFLYLGEYTHSLAKGVPTDANIWTVSEI